jgi:hypothetical protein
VAAESKADAGRLLTQAAGGFEPESWHSDLSNTEYQGWGNQGTTIKPERGVWGANSKKEKPKRIV